VGEPPAPRPVLHQEAQLGGKKGKSVALSLGAITKREGTEDALKRMMFIGREDRGLHESEKLSFYLDGRGR